MPFELSVICPVYNSNPEFLTLAAQSVLNHPCNVVIELILIDDNSSSASTIATLEKLKASDPRVLIITSPNNEGPASARNRGLNLATADWIGFLDADDLWCHTSIEQISEVLQNVPEAAWIVGNYSVLSTDNTTCVNFPLAEHYFSWNTVNGILEATPPQLTTFLIGNHWIHLGSSFIKRSMIINELKFPSDVFFFEDWLFFIRLSTISNLYYLNETFYILRRQGPSLTSSSKRLTSECVKSHLIARKDPKLSRYKRELRWALYALYKSLAANNLVLGRKWCGLRFAIWAFAIDPREYRDFYTFLLLFAYPHKTLDMIKVRMYTKSELNVLQI